MGVTWFAEMPSLGLSSLFEPLSLGEKSESSHLCSFCFSGISYSFSSLGSSVLSTRPDPVSLNSHFALGFKLL